MDVETIRQAFARRPFVPLELWLDSGEKLRVPSPEAWITEVWIGLTAVDGKPMLISPEAVSAIKAVGHTGKSKKKR